jgi:tRNA A-37 threonylcarbamoyl transferase component Bud32
MEGPARPEREGGVQMLLQQTAPHLSTPGALPKLKLQGRSGCRLEIRFNQGRCLVRKRASSVAYNHRLRMQARKQSAFPELAKNITGFAAPAVRTVGQDPETGLAWFDMEYIPGQKFSEYLIESTVDRLDCFVDSFIQLLGHEVRNSVLRPPPLPILEAKLASLSDYFRSHDMLGSTADRTLKRLCRVIPSADLPTGFCHGDLTLSNAVFSNGHIWLLDFLDSFIESPLIDIVKLRQDTRFFWSLFVDRALEAHQRGRLRQSLQYMDRRLDLFFSGMPLFGEWYGFLEALNLLRILPYLEDPHDLEFLNSCLEASGRA